LERDIHMSEEKKKASCLCTHSDEVDHHSSVMMSAYEIVFSLKKKKSLQFNDDVEKKTDSKWVRERDKEKKRLGVNAM